MPNRFTEAEHKAAIRTRTREARLQAGYSQERMAHLLGIELDAYKKWENRPNSAISVHKIADFCAIARIDCAALLDIPSRQELADLRKTSTRRSA